MRRYVLFKVIIFWLEIVRMLDWTSSLGWFYYFRNLFREFSLRMEIIRMLDERTFSGISGTSPVCDQDDRASGLNSLSFPNTRYLLLVP